MRWRTLAMAAVLAVSGCEVQKPAPSTPAAAFDLPDLSGGSLSLQSLHGKVVVLDFWATWCGPCLEEIPQYGEFWKKNRPRGVEVVGVVFDSGDPQEIQDFVREHRIPYHQLLGNDKLLDAYQANVGFPTTYVIDKNGVIRSKTVGSPPGKFDKLQQAVDQALGAP